MDKKPFKLEEGPFAGREVKFCDSTTVDTYSDIVREIMGFFGITRYWVSDESTISDFAEDDDLPRFNQHFNISMPSLRVSMVDVINAVLAARGGLN